MQNMTLEQLEKIRTMLKGIQYGLHPILLEYYPQERELFVKALIQFYVAVSKSCFFMNPSDMGSFNAFTKVIENQLNDYIEEYKKFILLSQEENNE